MFFMIGMWPGRKELGQHSGYNVYMVYNALVVFFIPVWKFDKQYFAEKDGRTYTLDEETGKKIERGEDVNLYWHVHETGSTSGRRMCPVCGYTTDDTSFEFCPHCGRKMN